MNNETVELEYPPELLLGLNANKVEFAQLIKEETAIALFRKGKISSGMAAKWLEIPRVRFLFTAMDQGAVLLEDTPEDLKTEMSLL